MVGVLAVEDKRNFLIWVLKWKFLEVFEWERCFFILKFVFLYQLTIVSGGNIVFATCPKSGTSCVIMSTFGT